MERMVPSLGGGGGRGMPTRLEAGELSLAPASRCQAGKEEQAARPCCPCPLAPCMAALAAMLPAALLAGAAAFSAAVCG